MATLINDPSLEDSLIADRRKTGADRYDEVWDGIYVMSPLADDEHQELVTALSAVLQIVVGWTGLGSVRAGVNVSDRETHWKQNYRVPDVAVFLRETTAQNRETHWFGGPDLAVEVLSEGDRARDKLAFYARVETRELLVVDRQRWILELYRLEAGALLPVGVATVERGETIAGGVVPLTFRLKADAPRPKIEVEHADGRQRWEI